MGTTTINLRIDADTARIYSRAPVEDRNKLSLLWGLLIREYKTTPSALLDLMDEIGDKAKRRGLTSRKLESILRRLTCDYKGGVSGGVSMPAAHGI